jgi:hypothetical protein
LIAVSVSSACGPTGHLDVIEADAAAGLRELERHGASQPGCAAGDDDDATAEGFGALLGLGPLLNSRRGSFAPA